MNRKRLEIELKINDLLNLMNHLDKGNQIAVMAYGKLVSAVEYDEVGRDLLKSIIKTYIKQLNKEIMSMGDDYGNKDE